MIFNTGRTTKNVADLFCRSAAFRGASGKSRGPKKQVRATPVHGRARAYLSPTCRRTSYGQL
jgi:hypothetical protein